MKRTQKIEYTVKDKLQEKALEDVVFGDFKDLEHFGSEKVQDKEEIESKNGIDYSTFDKKKKETRRKRFMLLGKTKMMKKKLLLFLQFLD